MDEWITRYRPAKVREGREQIASTHACLRCVARATETRARILNYRVFIYLFLEILITGCFFFFGNLSYRPTA
jgi:hypothetical protein